MGKNVPKRPQNAQKTPKNADSRKKIQNRPENAEIHPKPPKADGFDAIERRPTHKKHKYKNMENMPYKTTKINAAPEILTREARLDELARFADEIAEELPKEFYEKLNGGICIADRAKRHPQSDPRQPLYILGEYRNSLNEGRSIILYGGSILKLHGALPDEALKNELRDIIRHEFVHHIESLSGTRALEIEDELRLEEYKSSLADR